MSASLEENNAHIATESLPPIPSAGTTFPKRELISPVSDVAPKRAGDGHEGIPVLAVEQAQLVPPPVPADAIKTHQPPCVRASDSGEHDSNASGDQPQTNTAPEQTQRTKDTFESDDTFLPRSTVAGLAGSEGGAGVMAGASVPEQQGLAVEQQQSSILAASTAQMQHVPPLHMSHLQAPPVPPVLPPLTSSAQATNTLTGSGKKFGPGDKPKLQRPEGTIPCPRCSSEDTKFCYYNNYNTNQPRYFCKACQRYWTAGGTLRNVPPGSGKRKNKSSKTRTESQSTNTQQPQQSQQQPVSQQPPAIPMTFPGRPDLLHYGLQPGAMFMDPMFAAASIGKAAEVNSAAAAALGPFVPTPGLTHPAMAAAAAAAAAGAVQFNPQVAEQLLHLQKASTGGPTGSGLPLLPSGALSMDGNSLPPIPAPSGNNNADGTTAASALLSPMGGNTNIGSRTASSGLGLQGNTAEPASSLLALSGEDGSLGGRRVRLKTDPSLAGNNAPPTSSQQGSDSSPYGNANPHAGTLSKGDDSAAAVQQQQFGQGAEDASKGQQAGQTAMPLDWISYAAVANQQAQAVAQAQLQAQAAAAYSSTANAYGFAAWPYANAYSAAAAQQWAAYARYAQQAAASGAAWADPNAVKPEQQHKDSQAGAMLPPPLPNMTSPTQTTSQGGKAAVPPTVPAASPWAGATAWNAATALGGGLSPWGSWAAPAAAQVGAGAPLLQAMGQFGQAGLDGFLKQGDGQHDVTAGS